MLQGFNDENLYLIDMSYLNSPSELVYDLTSVLDNEQAKNRRIKIKLGGIDLNQAQLMSIKSLIFSINSSLVVLDGTSEITRASALATGIVYENSADMIPSETAFLHELQNNEAESQQENETSSDNQMTEEIQNQDENIPNIQENYTENEENNHQCEENFQNENNNNEMNYQSENINENNTEFHTEEAQQQEVIVHDEPIADIPQEQPEEQAEEVQPQEQIQHEFFNSAQFNEISAEENTNSETNIINTENDSSSSIPESSVIQEELSVIYGTEKKLEDIFESTGIKEEKFVSFKDIATAEEREYTKFDFELEAFPTKYLKQNICAGQVISFDGNLVIIGDCHEGSEISASGDITVWGDLSGSAYAGMNGNEKAKIRALRMNASQLRISTCFIKRPEALENPEMGKKPLIPEEASINKGEIGVYKIFK